MVYSIKVIKLLLICLIIPGVYAAGPVCQLKSGGSIDNILMQFGNAAMTWHTTIEPITKKFFFILFGMEFMWQLTIKKVFAGDIEKLWVFFFTRTVLCFFFAKYLINIEMYKGIIEFLAGLGSSMGGYSLKITPGSGLNTLSPSAVLSNFSCITDMIHVTTDSSGITNFITVKITMAIMQVILFLVLIFIAYYLMQILLQAYLLIYAGFIFAGFAGSAWTRSYWERYISAVINVGAKFFVVCLIMGVLNVQLQSWANDINKSTNADLSTLTGVIFNVFGTAIIIALTLWQLPEWFASVLNGQISALDNSSTSTTPMTTTFQEGNNHSKSGGEKGTPGAITRPADIVTGRNSGMNNPNINNSKSGNKPDPFRGAR